MTFTLQGKRVLLRDWHDDDLDAWAAINADPVVRQYFPSVADREQAAGEMARLRDHAEQHGFTFWAVEIPGTTHFAGMVGLLRTGWAAHFTPCVEIGWRLAVSCWGQGYATEAARLALDHGFTQLELDEVVALTAVGNLPSRAVMARIGMQHNPADDFDHPRVTAGHPLQRHVLYRINRTHWKSLHP